MSRKRKIIVIEDSPERIIVQDSSTPEPDPEPDMDFDLDMVARLDGAEDYLEVDDDIQAAVQASLSHNQNQPRAPPSPTPTADVSYGRQGWKKDFVAAKGMWGRKGKIEGYAGMEGAVRGLQAGDADDSISLWLEYEDLDGRAFKLQLEMVFQELKNYPASYKLLLFSSSDLHRRAESTFSRFSDIYDLDLSSLFGRLLSSLQGDDDADGGVPPDFDDGVYADGSDEDGVDPWADGAVDGLGDGEASEQDRYMDMKLLKEHFEQAKKQGYRPGHTKVWDFWVISYSIPLKNLPIDPNVLGMWDDGLVDAWKNDQRIVLLMDTRSYPISLDRSRYWLGFHKDYNPPLDVIVATTRGQGGMDTFFLSAPLTKFLHEFPRCYRLRTAFPLNWATSDQIGMDDEATREVFHDGVKPKNVGPPEKDDPVTKGLESNIPLCAFWWTLRRFINAPKYCLKCGLEVAIPSLRPYVCDKPLCIYGFMSLGLGPSVEHTIVTHPAVVDLLLSFAHAAASGQTRMDLPLHLNIEVPPEFLMVQNKSLGGNIDGPPTEPKLISSLDVTQQRRALVWLIDKLPKVSEIKFHLESGQKLKTIDAPSGSIGVLRWVIGSCRAYLKETKPSEGVQNSSLTTGSTDVKQFTFVVGSPEQETNFKEEIEKAQKSNKNCARYPTLLAFHGSPAERWHNILRTGLDFTDTIHGRAYGNGVYFAPDSLTSMGSYAIPSSSLKENADFRVTKATALVELVNVPSTFVKSNPYYVVANTKQIKPFLLLVQGANVPEQATDPEAELVPVKSGGELFKHDPSLALKPKMYNSNLEVRMPEKLTRTTYIDDEPDDATDQAIFHPAPSPDPAPKKPKMSKNLFKPSPQSRFDRLELMPPPSETSIAATKTLGKEFKALIKAQEEGGLPFHVDPEGENLYCWLLELHTFPPDSYLHSELKKHSLPSVIAELRFPASFPHAPPFMRILHPRMLQFMYGGGGNITAGGSICNELMTSTGWNPAFNVEAIVREAMINMTEATPPAKLDPRSWDRPYSMHEAIEAYKRVASAHGWQIPKDFDRLSK